MGRFWTLIFAFLGNEHPINDYYSYYHQDVHVFAERGLKKAYQSAVIVNAFNIPGDTSLGSGNYMQVNTHKFILTAYHVVEGKKNIFITEKSGDHHQAFIKYIDKSNDIAILKVYENMNYTKSIEFTANSDRPVGREVFYCGHPDNNYFKIFSGRLNGNDGPWVTIDSFAWPGSSGSVVFDEYGNVMGVVSAVSTSSPTGVLVLVPNLVRLGPMNHLSRDLIEEILRG